MSGSKHKSSCDVAGTVKKRQAITMETKVKIIEKVVRGEKMVDVARSYNEELTNEDLMELEAQRED